ncbi:MAG: tetratricopeptide repeat protein [Cyanobacteria bacterium J06581_3]
MSTTKQKVQSLLHKISAHPLQELTEEARAYRQSGWEAFLDQNFDLAKHCYTRAIEAGHEHPDLQLMLGHLCYQSNDLEAAREWYDRARLLAISESILAEETNPIFSLYVGNTHLKQKNYSAAIEEYETAVSLSKNFSYELKSNIFSCLTDTHIQRALERANQADWGGVWDDLDQALKRLNEAKHCCSRVAVLACKKAEFEHTFGVIKFYQAAYCCTAPSPKLKNKTDYQAAYCCKDPSPEAKRNYKIAFLKEAIQRFSRALTLEERSKVEKTYLQKSEVYSDQAWTYLELSRLESEEDTDIPAAKGYVNKAEKSIDRAIKHNQLLKLSKGGRDAPELSTADSDELVATADMYSLKGLIAKEKQKRFKQTTDSIQSYDDAIYYYQQAIKRRQETGRGTLSPEEIYSQIGELHIQKEAYEDAIASYQKAASIAESEGAFNSIYHGYLGNAYAELASRHREEDNPENKEIIAQYEKKSEEAFARYYHFDILQKEKFGHSGIDDSYNSLGNTYYNLEDYPAAIAQYKAAIAVAPEEAVYHGNLAGAYEQNIERLRAGQHSPDAIDDCHKKAIKHYRAAIELASNKSDKADYHNKLGNAYFDVKDYQLAVEQYQAAADLTPNVAVYYRNQANAYKQIAADMSAQAREVDYRKAEAAYRKAIAVESSSPNNYIQLGHLYMEMNLPEEAVAQYSLALDKEQRDNPDYHTFLGLAYRRSQNLEKAEAEYRTALRLSPEHENVSRNLGLLLHAMGKYLDATQELEKVHRQNPDDVDVLISLGLSYIELEREEEGIRYLNRAQKDWRAGYVLGRHYNKTKQFELAIEALQQARRQSIGESAAEVEDIPTQLEAAYQKLKEAHSQNESYLEALARNEVDASIQYYQQAAERFPENYRYRVSLGKQYYKRSQQSAQQPGEKGDPQDLKAAAEQWEKALQLLQQASSTEEQQAPSTEEALVTNNLGTAYDGLGQYRKARALYKRAAELSEGKNFVPFYNIGNASYRLRQFRAALKAFLTAIDIIEQSSSKKYALAYYNAGNCYFQLNQFSKAIELLETARQLNPSSCEVSYNLGVVRWIQGKREQAISAWYATLHVQPDHKAAKENLQLIEAGQQPNLQIYDPLHQA